jgi:hypothetical protein
MAAVFGVLIAGIIASGWEAMLARRAEQAAATESANAKAISDFLQNDLLAQASPASQARPDIKPDADLKVRTALDRAASRIADKFEKHPLVEAAIRHTVGNTYKDLGLYAEAQRQLERALELRNRALGANHSDTLGAMHTILRCCMYSEGNRRRPSRSLPRLCRNDVACWVRRIPPERLLLSGHDGLVRRKATIPWESRSASDRARQRIVRLYEKWGREHLDCQARIDRMVAVTHPPHRRSSRGHTPGSS